MSIKAGHTLLTLTAATATTTGSEIIPGEKHNALLAEVATLTMDSGGTLTSIEIQHSRTSGGTFKTIGTFGPYTASISEPEELHIIPVSFILKGVYRAKATIASGTWTGTVILSPAEV